MHVVVSKRDLIRVLERCQGVADRKSTMPVLGNVLLEVTGPDQLRVAATDLCLAVSGRVPAKVERGGSVAVGARDLFERVKQMPENGQVQISTDGAAMTIRSVGTARRYTLHGVPGEEFPSLPRPDEAASRLELGVDVLARLISGTVFSISGDETRMHLNSALFEWDGDRVRMVTTDGHRLSKAELQIPGKHATASMLIPQKGIHELRKLCEEARKDAPRGEAGAEPAAPTLTLAQSGPSVFFEVAGLHFSVKLVDAQFPPYQQVIPDQTDRAIRVPSGALADALRAVKIAASDRTGGVRLTVVSGKLRISTESPESGEGFDEVNVDYEGPEVTVGFNATYILDVLGSIDDPEVILGVSGELDPCVIRPAKESARSSCLAVVMPMRI
jgi:DNA polymerase-3 subunit beta